MSGPSDVEEIAARVEAAAVAKAEMPILRLVALGILAGAFIAFGAMAYTLVVTGSTLGFGPTRALGGLAFSLGLILVGGGGAELFTGNNLIAMAWAGRKITLVALLRNWLVVYAANFAGALGAALLVYLSGLARRSRFGRGRGGGARRRRARAARPVREPHGEANERGRQP